MFLILPSCRNKTKWFNYDCKWECTEFNFYLGKQGNNAVFTYNEVEYHLDTAISNNATYIRFFSGENSEEILSDENQVMFANTTYKDDILYLEFTQDDIANLEGKTLTFTKVLSE